VVLLLSLVETFSKFYQSFLRVPELQVVGACIKRSLLWRHITVYELH